MVQAPTETGRSMDALRGQRIAISGSLASMTRDEAAKLIKQCGGEMTRVPTRRTSLVVVGQEGGLLDEGRHSEGLERAKHLQEQGVALEIVSEQRFLEMIGLTGDRAQSEFQRLYTTTQLSRILKLPGRRIRAWVRRGFIRPARTVHRLDYFDFRQVTELRTLRTLAEKGVRLEEIRRGFERLRRSFPGADLSLAQLVKIEPDGQLVFRLENGELVEPTGQLRLDLDSQARRTELSPGGEAAQGRVLSESDPPPAAPAAFTPAQAASTATASSKAIPARPRYSIKSPIPSADWFDQAVELESQDRLEDAAKAYEQALEQEPSAETAFNLGNVLYELGRLRESRRRLQQAVELDSESAEAWNNLASVCAELELWEEAVCAAERALAIAPDYADVHYNLAHALHALGRRKEARRHGRAYLEQDPHSEWSRRLRLTLGLA
jgi:tetratricopeptide (TPR) repeat protein